MEWILHPDQLTDIPGFTTGEATSLPFADAPHDPAAQDSQSSRRRLKRPHTKSRRGCLNCKRRKVKCQETLPSCLNCTSRSMECTYPLLRSDNEISEQPHPSANSLTDIGSHLTGPFTGEDLRFFQHFLLVSRPHLPFGSEQAWMTDVPAYAHECPHLMHAILSLGATHYDLMIPNQSPYKAMALSHRSKALKQLSFALDNIDDCSAAFLDGILATCYALIFQAYYMTDGMVDFAVMVRGCTLITAHIQNRFKGSRMFLLQTADEVDALVAPWLSNYGHPDQEAIELCIMDIDKLQQILQDQSTLAFLKCLRNTYSALLVSIREAFSCLGDVYMLWHSMENQQFMEFIASENVNSRALFMHYFAIDTLMRPFLLMIRDAKHPGLSFGAIAIGQWANAVYYSLPASVQPLVKHEADLIRRHKEDTFFSMTGNLPVQS